MLAERDALVVQEQMKDRLRRREEDRLLAAAPTHNHKRRSRSRRLKATTAVRALGQKLLAG